MLPQLDQDDRIDTARRARVALLTALSELGGQARRQPLLAKALAEGDFSEGELQVPAPRDTRARYENDVAFRLARTLLKLQREGLVESPAWNVWRLTEPPAPARPAAADPIAPGRAAELARLPYQEYLRTPEWRRIRAAALARAGLRCALDRTHTEHLEVHHTTFERLGAELSSDLIVLCRSCHQAHHHVGPATTPAEAEAHRAAASIPPPSPPSLHVTAVTNPPVPALAPQRSRLRRLLGGV